jgi:hypothetical protein
LFMIVLSIDRRVAMPVPYLYYLLYKI